MSISEREHLIMSGIHGLSWRQSYGLRDAWNSKLASSIIKTIIYPVYAVMYNAAPDNLFTGGINIYF